MRSRALTRMIKSLRSAGPYLLLELLLPGGTLLALLLWLTTGAGRGQLSAAPIQPQAATAIERLYFAGGAA